MKIRNLTFSILIICFSITAGKSQVEDITYDTTGFSQAKLLVYPGVYKNIWQKCIIRDSRDYVSVKKGGNLIAEYHLSDNQSYELRFACWYDSNNLLIKDSIKGEVLHYKYNKKGRLVSIERFRSTENFKEIWIKCVFTYSNDRIISNSIYHFDNSCKKIEVINYDINHMVLDWYCFYYNKKGINKYKEIVLFNNEGNPKSRKIYKKGKLVSNLEPIPYEDWELYESFFSGNCKPIW